MDNSNKNIISSDYLSIPFDFLLKHIHINTEVIHYAISKNVYTLGDFINLKENINNKSKLQDNVLFFQRYILENVNALYTKYQLENINIKINNLKSDKSTLLKNTSCPRVIYQKLYKHNIKTIDQVRCLNDIELQTIGFSSSNIEKLHIFLNDNNNDRLANKKYKTQYSDNIIKYSESVIQKLGNNPFVKIQTVIRCVNKIFSKANIDFDVDNLQDVEMQKIICNSPLLKNQIKRAIAKCISANKHIAIDDLLFQLHMDINTNIILDFLHELIMSSDVYTENDKYRCIKFPEYIETLNSVQKYIITEKANGNTYKQISRVLNVSDATIGNHISKILKKAYKHVFYEDAYNQDSNQYKSIKDFCTTEKLGVLSYFYLKQRF